MSRPIRILLQTTIEPVENGISRFRRRGGGILATHDHMDLGSSISSLGGIGAAHWFHSRHRHPSGSVPSRDDRETAQILWPNFHSGANGDCQRIEPAGVVHPILHDPAQPEGIIGYLPAHPHEGAVVAPPEDPSARVIATGVSKASGDRFNLVVAFEPTPTAGPALAQSTFHHFADYNWDVSQGCPDFVTEPVGSGMANTPEALQSVHAYVRNAALWLVQHPDSQLAAASIGTELAARHARRMSMTSSRALPFESGRVLIARPMFTVHSLVDNSIRQALHLRRATVSITICPSASFAQGASQNATTQR